ncbi:MAG: AAA family ATPase [Firmicutes bacterium]|nr:AAA family ATPase [Bacillota bacterium]
MFLDEIRITNFRKFGGGENGEPGITIKFNKGLNVLIGENDSGKTCVIDAIRLVLSTQSGEFFRIYKEDFHEDSRFMKIECIIRGFNEYEAKDFLEWLGIDDEKKFFLRLIFSAKRDGKDKIFVDDIRAGLDEEGQILSSKAKELLRATYLKPLRDAEIELAARRNSRLSQILYAHPEFKDEESHELVRIMKNANAEIKEYFNYREDSNDEKVLKILNTFLYEFSDNDNILKSYINITDPKLKAILEKLDLVLNKPKPGHGSYNQLYISTELLLLRNKTEPGLKLALIEEIEAHLHPQAQLRVIEYLQNLCNSDDSNIQIILTTHSINLASHVKLDNLFIFAENTSFPLRKGTTELKDGDYLFLERFLDATKANLFFAKGVLIVEGDAENIIFPAIAKLIEKKLTKYGVSIVNVGSTALLRYARIFMRKDELKMKLPVAVVADCDQAVYGVKEIDGEKQISCLIDNEIENSRKVKEKHDSIRERYEKDNVKAFVSPQWTLEFDIACSCLKTKLHAAIKMAEDYEKLDKKDGQTIKESTEYLEEAREEIQSWNNLDMFEIAKNITEKVVIRKSISKAVVAQCFAKILSESNFSDEEIKNIRNDIYLKYIVDAIDYVTRGQK